MENDDSYSIDKIQLDEYKSLETKLFGEIVKSCQSFSGELSIISIVGILDLVKQEIKDLDKQKLQFLKEEYSPE